MKFNVDINGYILINVKEIKKCKLFKPLDQIKGFKRAVYYDAPKTKKFENAKIAYYRLENEKQESFSYILFINTHYFMCESIEIVYKVVNHLVGKCNDVSENPAGVFYVLRALKKDIGECYLKPRYEKANPQKGLLKKEIKYDDMYEFMFDFYANNDISIGKFYYSYITQQLKAHANLD